MTHILKTPSGRVQSRDDRTHSGKTQPVKRELRFREAIPDYVTLLAGAATTGLEPAVHASLNRWNERWALVHLSGVSGDELQAYFRELSLKGFEPRDLDREKALLKSFYRWAVRSGWTTNNPTVDMEHTRVLPEHANTAWSGPEQDRLLQVAKLAWRKPGSISKLVLLNLKVSNPGRPEHEMWLPPMYLYPLLLVGLRCGLRLGHLLHLEWRHVDLDQRRIRIPAEEVKSGRELNLPMDGDVWEVLCAIFLQTKGLPVLPRRIFDAAGLPVWKGSPNEHDVLHAFRMARKKARIPEGDFNSLRLTFARNCARAGVPLEYPLKVGDWDDARLVEQVYDAHRLV